MSIVAAVQMASGPGVGANLHEAEKLIARAADGGETRGAAGKLCHYGRDRAG